MYKVLTHCLSVASLTYYLNYYVQVYNLKRRHLKTIPREPNNLLIGNKNTNLELDFPEKLLCMNMILQYRLETANIITENIRYKPDHDFLRCVTYFSGKL